MNLEFEDIYNIIIAENTLNEINDEDELLTEQIRNQSNLPVNDNIINSIKNKNLVLIYYKGTSPDQEEGYRLIEPYVFFQGLKIRGKVMERAKKRYYLRAFVIKEFEKPTKAAQRVGQISKISSLVQQAAAQISGGTLTPQAIQQPTEFKNFSGKSVSRTQQEPYWRTFRRDRVQKYVILKDLHFNKARPEYNAADKDAVRIIEFAKF